MKKRIVAALLVLALAASLLPFGLSMRADAISPYFFNTHTDWHFDLTQKPNSRMTVEEFIALCTAYSYWSEGTAGTPKPDRDGNLPSDWAAPYIVAETAKGTITPAELDYDAPATLAFAMEFIARAKGLFSYNMVNYYELKGTEGLSNAQRLTLNAALDYHLFAYTPGMDVSVTLPRMDLEQKYLVPEGSLSAPEAPRNYTQNYRWSMAFFDDQYNDLGAHRAQGERLIANKDNFNLVTMQTYYLRPVGDPKVSYIDDQSRFDEVNKELLVSCRKNGLKVLAGLQNYYDTVVLDLMLHDSSVIDEVVAQTMAIVEATNLDGVNLDIEYFGSTYRGVYSALLQKLSKALRARGKMIMATVGAYMRDDLEAGSLYDYSVIREAADLVNVILYDDHPAKSYTAGSVEAGSISNYLYIGRCLQYAAAAIGREKVLLSVANYGVDYNTTNHTAENIPTPRVESLIKTYNPTIQSTSSDVDDAYFRYKADDGSEHLVWYESQSGLQHRLDYATRYGLAGVTCFTIAGDNPGLFRKMGARLSSLPFEDVAKDWSYDSIRWAVAQGITTGTSATTFSPADTCTRGQVVTFLWRAMGKPAPKTSSTSFTDVKAGAYYYNAMLWAVENNVTSGVSSTSFAPDNPCTRGQVVTFLWRANGKPRPKTASSEFVDVKSDAFYYTAMLWAVENKITTGVNKTSFAPDNPCTRAQVVTFLYRAENLK